MELASAGVGGDGFVCASELASGRVLEALGESPRREFDHRIAGKGGQRRRHEFTATTSIEKYTAFVQCTQTLRVRLESELDGGIDEAHTPGEMGRSHTAATESPNGVQGRCESCTEEHFG